MIYVSVIKIQHKIWNNILGFNVAQIHNKPFACWPVNTKQVQHRAVSVSRGTMEITTATANYISNKRTETKKQYIYSGTKHVF
jgi:hypothetical protein